MSTKLPRSVYLKSGTYWHVTADGPKRRWRKLTRASDGLPALYAALAELLARDLGDDRMPALISDWQRDVMSRHAEKTQVDERARCLVVAESFAEFRAAQVQAPHVAEFLRPLRSRTVAGVERPSPRTHNLYRALLRELMRYAIERGYRTDNPVEHVRTMGETPRDRYITDSELRRIKVHACRGADQLDTRSGPMLCALIDMAYLTGQRIGDLLTMEWAQVSDAGVAFKTAKTGRRVLIEWTPKLRDAIARLRRLRIERQAFTARVFTTQTGAPYTYSGAHTAWRRAVKRAGITGAHFHDLRAKALTDKEAREGMAAARAMGAHTTEAQTADYVRQKAARKTRATR